MKRDPAIIVGSAALAAGAWYLLSPGRSLSTAVADMSGLLTGSISLSDAQRAQAAIISAEFGSAGFGWLYYAAVANAYAESRLDPLAISGYSGEDSVGLFQLNAAGAGKGLSTAQRQDPVINTRRILDEVRGAHGAPVRDARGAANNVQLASLFAQHIERCWACGWGGGSSELAIRSAYVGQLFGPTIAGSVP